MSIHIKLPKDKIAAFCCRNHIRSLAFFGSVLRSDFGPDSDVDALVEFEAGKELGLLVLRSEATSQSSNGVGRDGE